MDLQKLIADAKEALDNLDDYARMPTGVDAIGPRTVLESFIASVERMSKLPSTPEEVVDFIGPNFDWQDMQGSTEEWRYKLSVHDLLSCFQNMKN